MPTDAERDRKRPIVYDVTHLASRLTGETTTGIDWVDRAYVRHLARSERLACGLHYGLLSPHLLSKGLVAELSDRHERKFAHTASPSASSSSDQTWRRLKEWLAGRSSAESLPKSALFHRRSVTDEMTSLAFKARMRIAHNRRLEIPEGAVYLNVAQHGFEYPALFGWLDSRPDVAPVFVSHDLLPLDFPEYFREGYKGVFRRRFDLIEKRAKAIIATCDSTANRIRAEFRAKGRTSPPIHVQPLASPLDAPETGELRDSELSDTPYFVAVGTIEPRKNHTLLLNVWRELARSDGEAPKLVLVGGRGWGSEDVVYALERSATLALHIRQASGLASDSLRALLANARALLAPNLAEGYGIPLVEALTVGTPVICSDIPVFREVTQDCATFLSPLDGAGWRSTIRRFTDGSQDANGEARRLTQNFKAPNWASYFTGVEKFLDSM